MCLVSKSDFKQRDGKWRPQILLSEGSFLKVKTIQCWLKEGVDDGSTIAIDIPWFHFVAAFLVGVIILSRMSPFHVNFLRFRPCSTMKLQKLLMSNTSTCIAVSVHPVKCLIDLYGREDMQISHKTYWFFFSFLSAPILLEFYRGMEIHPRLLGVDIKQWTNCRVGMMAWQILIVAFLIAGGRHGVNPGHLANVVIQTFYITKFYYWETGYFNTLDITLDRAGYYICWGCLVWVPGFYTYSSFYLVAHPSTLTEQAAFFVALLGNLLYMFCFYNTSLYGGYTSPKQHAHFLLVFFFCAKDSVCVEKIALLSMLIYERFRTWMALCVV